MSSNVASQSPRKFLSADSLIQGLRERFEEIQDSRRSASVTQHRTILDEVPPGELDQCFADIFYELQRGGELEGFVFDDGHYLLAIDGTGCFCSTKISCPHCLVKNSKSGKTEYSHQMVAAVLVHPNQKVVIPIAVEAIVQQDGNNKNDCERNAVRRLLQKVRRLHPKLEYIVIEDGLASNGPHIEDLIKLNFKFILGAKPNDHTYLFDNFMKQSEIGLVEEVSTAASGKTFATQTQWLDHLQLNASKIKLTTERTAPLSDTTKNSYPRRESLVKPSEYEVAKLWRISQLLFAGK